MKRFDINDFISEYVTKRPASLFQKDIDANREELIRKIEGKRVLVVGGAGSIGSSFIRTILPYKPASLIVADINENALAELTRDLRSTKGMYVPEEYIPYPMDYSAPVFERMFRARKGFDIVANFSAHKHVRSEKDVYSVEALLQNNVINAKKLLDLMKEFPPEEYFCVSTDKAANPVNIMGASKRAMEDVIFSYSDYFPVKTARFANVAFSNGSLPAGFLARIDKMQPISAPNDVKRYFVSPIESGQICMLACMLGNNREIFFPRLREEQEMTFSDIAEQLLKVKGYNIKYCDSDEQAIDEAVNLKNGSNDYPVHFSGSDTTGEKPYEEFFTDSEKTDMSKFSALGIIIDKEKRDKHDIDSFIGKLSEVFDRDITTKEEIVEIIHNFLPNFKHNEMGKSLDEKM